MAFAADGRHRTARELVPRAIPLQVAVGHNGGGRPASTAELGQNPPHLIANATQRKLQELCYLGIVRTGHDQGEDLAILRIESGKPCFLPLRIAQKMNERCRQYTKLMARQTEQVPSLFIELMRFDAAEEQVKQLPSL